MEGVIRPLALGVKLIPVHDLVDHRTPEVFGVQIRARVHRLQMLAVQEIGFVALAVGLADAVVVGVVFGCVRCLAGDAGLGDAVLAVPGEGSVNHFGRMR